MINPFTDARKIPKLSINVKVKIKTEDLQENADWNTVFGYIMKKPRTKLEFLITTSLRELNLHKVKLTNIEEYISNEDYLMLKKIENVFDNNLTVDIKAFILAILRIPVNTVEKLVI